MRVRRPVALGFLLVVASAGCGKEREKKVPSVKDHPDYVPFAERAYGEARIVNLYANPQTAPRALDVWVGTDDDAFGSKLPERVDFGRATTWFRGTGAVMVPAGAVPTGERLGRMDPVWHGRKVTYVLKAHTGREFTDIGHDGFNGLYPAPTPQPGRAAIQVDQEVLEAFRDELERRLGFTGLLVGDGMGTCRSSRDGDGFLIHWIDGVAVFDVDPGTVVLSLHASGDDFCAGTPLGVANVELRAGESGWAFVYTRDGTALDVLTLPVGRD